MNLDKTYWLKMFPGYIQKIISNYQVFGVIPLDKMLHFIVGWLIAAFMRYKGVSFKYIFVVIICVCMIKEIIDSGTLQSDFRESVFDTVATMIYPSIIFIIFWIKKK